MPESNSTDGSPRAVGCESLSQSDDDDRLLEMLARGELRISELVRDESSQSVPILQLAQRLMQPHNLERLRKVAMLAAVQRDMLLSQLKLNAMVRLAELTDDHALSNEATGIQSSGVGADEARLLETQRKACVDLLKCPFDVLLESPLRRNPSGSIPTITHKPSTINSAPSPPISEAFLLDCLEKMGREDDDDQYEPRAQASAPGIIRTDDLMPPDARSTFGACAHKGPVASGGASGSYQIQPPGMRSSLDTGSCKEFGTSWSTSDSWQESHISSDATNRIAPAMIHPETEHPP